MNPEIRQKIKSIINKLWAGGISDPITYIVQLSYLIYLKMLDDEESRRQHRLRATGKGKSLFPQQAKRFRWSEWRFKSGPDLVKFIRDEVFQYMSSLVEDEPLGGGTGHTIRVCLNQQVPVVTQQIWRGWGSI